MQQVELRRDVKGYLPKFLKSLAKYLKDQQPLFDTMDYQIADIAEQHPDYTIKEITERFIKQNPGRKWDAALARRVQRLLKNVPW